MAKKTVTLKMSDELRGFLEDDALIVYGKDRQLSKHIQTILESYMETRRNSGIDLDALQEKIDKMFDSETKESLTQWLLNHRGKK